MFVPGPGWGGSRSSAVFCSVFTSLFEFFFEFLFEFHFVFFETL